MRKHILGGIALPGGMIWVDEFDWTPVEKTTEYSTTGALLIDTGLRRAGRPITLEAEENAGWLGMSRSTLTALHALAAQPDAVHALRLADGRQFTVQFAPGDAITAQPIGRPELPGSTHPYIATVRLIEV